MRISLADVLRQLRAEGLAPDGVEETVRAALRARPADDDVPWYVRVATGFAAWIASLLLIAYIGPSRMVQSGASALVVGAIMVGAAFFLRRQATADFAQHFAVATSFAGQVLMMGGVFAMTQSPAATGAVGVLVSAALVRLMPDTFHRFLSTVAGCAAATVTVLAAHVPGGYQLVVLAVVALGAYVWRAGLRTREPALAAALTPAGYGLVVALFGMLLLASVGNAMFGGLAREAGMADAAGARWLTTLAITGALAWLALAIFDEHGTPRGSSDVFVTVVGVLLLGVVTLDSPGITAGAAVLALGFDRRNPVLVGLAALFLLVFGSVYYYSLELTLLQKSAVLVGSGVLCLAARALVPSTPPSGEAA